MSVPAPPPLSPAIAHRGAKGHAPENTLASMRKAVELGARWVELDTKLTADNELILFHDDTLNRTTDGRGPVAGATLAEIRKLDAGHWFSDSFTGEAVPTFAETMEYLVGQGVGIVVEIKASPGREVETAAATVKMLVQRWAGGPSPILICSFSEASLDVARQIAPDIPRGYLTLKFKRDWAARMRQLGCATLHMLDRRYTEARVNAIRQAGYRMLAFTINDVARARTLLSWGVESIITDYPERISALRPTPY